MRGATAGSGATAGGDDPPFAAHDGASLGAEDADGFTAPASMEFARPPRKQGSLHVRRRSSVVDADEEDADDEYEPPAELDDAALDALPVDEAGDEDFAADAEFAELKAQLHAVDATPDPPKRRSLMRLLREVRAKLQSRKLKWTGATGKRVAGDLTHRRLSIRRGSALDFETSSTGYGALRGRLSRGRVMDAVRVTYLMEDARYVALDSELAALKADPFRDERRLAQLEETMAQRAEQLERERADAKRAKDLAQRARQDELARKQGVIEAIKDAQEKKRTAAVAEAIARAEAATGAKAARALRAEQDRVRREGEVLKRRAAVRARTGRRASAMGTEEVQILHRHFELMDADGSGAIDRGEFAQFYRNVGGDVLNTKELFALFDGLADHNGHLGFDSFLKLYAKLAEAEQHKQKLQRPLR